VSSASARLGLPGGQPGRQHRRARPLPAHYLIDGVSPRCHPPPQHAILPTPGGSTPGRPRLINLIVSQHGGGFGALLGPGTFRSSTGSPLAGRSSPMSDPKGQVPTLAHSPCCARSRVAPRSGRREQGGRPTTEHDRPGGAYEAGRSELLDESERTHVTWSAGAGGGKDGAGRRAAAGSDGPGWLVCNRQARPVPAGSGIPRGPPGVPGVGSAVAGRARELEFRSLLAGRDWC
jgi:hypothetical protein